MPRHLWVFRARVERVIDGDTLDITIDCGFRSTRVERIRLLGVNAPEKTGSTRREGILAQDFTTLWCADALYMTEWPIVIQTKKSDAFGRYLATVWRVVDGACLNNDLVTAGMAVIDIRE